MSGSDGARFDLRLLRGDSQGAVYSAQFDVGEAQLIGQAAVDAQSGAVQWQEQDSPEAPAWLLKYATMALRAASRTQKTEGWARRLSRWRAAPSRSAKT